MCGMTVEWSEWEVEAHSTEELFAGLREVPLQGDARVLVYADSAMSLEVREPTELVMAQYYVLRPLLERMRSLRLHLESLGHDLLQLEGYLTMTNQRTGEVCDLLPPIVEESVEANGRCFWLVNDGVHRVYLAYLEHRPLRVVHITDVAAPFYAYPIPGDCWAKLQLMDERPPDLLKRWLRVEDKLALYRDFNRVFRGVSGRRAEDRRRYTGLGGR